MSAVRAVIGGAGALLVLASCASTPAPPRLPEGAAPLSYDPHPEPPAIMRDVSLIDDSRQFTRPFVPGYRTTMDGRVALRVQGGPPGDEQLETMLSFALFVPERLEGPVMTGAPGAGILSEPETFDVVFPPALDPAVNRLGHHAICDPTTEFPRPGERPNPYPCGANDCYDLVVVNTTAIGLSSQIWGTPVTIEVEAPKTARARIARVTLGEPVRGATITANNELTEPAVTSDGRLLTGRWGRAPRSWTNPNDGVTYIRPYDLLYSVLPDDAAPCDVTRWTVFHPMSHAPYDPMMVGRYGLAAYPFRDSEGEPIPDGEDLGGTYPWVDREGANVFMTGVHGRLSEQSETRYPRRCASPGCEAYRENIDFDRGFMVAGLWTHGRFVHLDGMINHLDWAVGVEPQTHWMVDLYRSEGAPVAVRVGGGRYIDRLRGGDHYPPGYTHNANILDSLQNVATHHPAGRPVTPRDVVWVMSNGVASDEIAFDDLLDPLALIVSNMQASITQIRDANGATLALPYHRNGQVRRFEPLAPVLPLAAVSSYELEPDLDEDAHLQNGATSLELAVPPFGLIEAGTARIEPVALGGVYGRGLWLDGNNRARYTIPAQRAGEDLDQRDLYVGIFVDPRTTEGATRALLTFPDGTSVRLVDDRRVQLVDERGFLADEVELPETDGWMHLGIRARALRRELTVLVDGFPLARLETPPMLRLPSGELVLGRAEEGDVGVRGWVDDFVVLAHDVNPEVACNHAGGTLVRVEAEPRWESVADRYPAWAHDEIAAAAGQAAGARFACFHDYSGDYRAHLANIPSGTIGMREAINFPEGPLRAGAPRPDSSQNEFCLSCHHADGQGGLSLEALAYRPDLLAEHDPRRQPMQPPRRVFGHIPAGWIAPGVGAGGPDLDMVAPAEGALVDRWMLAR